MTKDGALDDAAMTADEVAEQGQRVVRLLNDLTDDAIYWGRAHDGVSRPLRGDSHCLSGNLGGCNTAGPGCALRAFEDVMMLMFAHPAAPGWTAAVVQLGASGVPHAVLRFAALPGDDGTWRWRAVWEV